MNVVSTILAFVFIPLAWDPSRIDFWISSFGVLLLILIPRLVVFLNVCRKKSHGSDSKDARKAMFRVWSITFLIMIGIILLTAGLLY
jgi:hypothetical protein